MANAPYAAGMPPEPPATSRARIFAARYVLLAAAAGFFTASVIWGVPAAYSLCAMMIVAAVAAFAPRRVPARLPAAGDSSRSPGAVESAMAATLEALPQAGFILDATGTVSFANSRAAELFPATRPADPFTLTFRSPEIGEALSTAQAGRAQAVEFHEPGESTSIYAVTFSPLGPAGVTREFILVSFADVSDRLAIARMRSDFVANASHELRTPLASLTGFIETLLGPARNDREASEKFLKVMLDQARRMRRLIDDLLSLSRAEMRVHRRPVERADLVEILKHVGDALGPLGQEHGVTVAVDAPDRPVPVTGERDELIQVFQNLVENGIRYGASGGRVEIGLEQPREGRNEVAVHVQDHGPGIAPEHVPRLTERFYRVDVGASREMKGTGLGLAIVKHILTRHQGRLDVQSRPGEGARFTVVLPAAPVEGNARNSQ